jgi:DNA replication protein DnaC
MKCKTCSVFLTEEEESISEFFPRLKTSGKCSECIAIDAKKLEWEGIARNELARKNYLAARINQVVPLKYQDNDPQRKEFKELLRRCNFEDLTNWIGIVGPPGYCKTRVAAHAAKHHLNAGRSVEWTTAMEFQGKTIELFDPEKSRVAEASHYFRKLKRCDLLVFDDFGKNSWTENFQRKIYDVFAYRYDMKKQICWTANTHPIYLLENKSLSAEFAQPLISRIIESSVITEI